MPPMLPNPGLLDPLSRLAKSAFGSDVKVKNEPRWRDYVEKSAREYSARQEQEPLRLRIDPAHQQEQAPGIPEGYMGPIAGQPQEAARLIDKWGLEDPELRQALIDADVQFDPKYADFSVEERMAELRRLVAAGVPEMVAAKLVIPPHEGERPTIQTHPYYLLQSRDEEALEKGRRQVQEDVAGWAARYADPVLQERARQEYLKMARYGAGGLLLAATAPGSVGGGTVGALGFAALKYGGKRLLPKAISAIARHSPDIAAGIFRGEVARRAAKGADLPWQAQIAADVAWGGGLPGVGLVKKGAQSLLGVSDDAARAVPRGVEEAFDAARAGRGTGDVVLDGSTIPDVVGGTARVGKEVAEEIPAGATVLGETAGVLPRLTEDVPDIGRSLQEVSEESIEGQARKEIRPTVDQTVQTPDGFELPAPFTLRAIVPPAKGPIERIFRNSWVGKVFAGKDDVTRAVQVERERLREVGENISNTVSSRLDEIYRQNFDVDGKGQILNRSLQGIDESLPGAPTIQDIAARFPIFERHLSPGQRAAILQIKDELASYTDIARGLDMNFRLRADIMDGGFYIPRGNAMNVSRARAAGEGAEGFDWAIKGPGGYSGRKGKPGFQKHAKFTSAAEGIKEGFEYDTFGTVVKGFVHRMSDVVSDAHVAKQLKNMTDSTGSIKGIGKDVVDIAAPGLRASVEELRSGITSRLGVLAKQGIRLPEQERAAKEAEKRVRDWRNASDQDLDRVVSLQLGGSTDDLIKETKRELRRLEVGESKALAALLKTEPPNPYGGPSFKWSQLFNESKTTIKSFKEEMGKLTDEYASARKRAGAPGEGRKFISGEFRIGQHLQNISFTEELADAITKQLRSELPLSGEGSGFIAKVRAVNQFLVGLGATLDNSGLGIQGLLGMVRHPTRYGKALEINLKAWGVPSIRKGPGGRQEGSRALGKYLLIFDEKVKKLGRMTSTQWADFGLRIGAGEHEYRLGTGIAAKIGDWPGIRQANRAFGVFGDTLRLEWADDMLKTELSKGRTLDEIRSSGDMDLISNVVNNATGYSSKGAFGSAGDLLLFAPRFLQARMKTVASGAMGLRPGANLQQREARAALLRLIGYGTTVTVLANMVRGKKTDYRMFVNGRYNSNFMRIRDVGGRDFSVFGPYDSILRVIATALAGQGEDSIVYQRLESMRGLLNPGFATMWDLIEERDVTGRRTRDTGGGEAWSIGQNFIPFSGRELPEIVTDVAQGTERGRAEEIGGGLLALLAEMGGGKQAPLSFTDRANAFAAQLYGGAGPKPNWGDFASWWDNPETTYENLDEKRKKRVRALVLKFYPEFKRKGKFWIQVGGEKEEKEEKYKVDWS
jgi:hypothetical protein